LKKIIFYVKEIVKRNRKLIENFSYLSILQLFNLVLPLITYPYLIKTLGKETYGLVVFSQAVISYLLVLVNYGFNISATKQVSLNRQNLNKLDEIISSVFIIKIFFLLLSFIILFFVLFFISDTNNHKLLFYLTMWMCVYDVMFPIWYFQGIEQMKYITYLTVLSRTIFLAFIFIFVHSSKDYILIPIISGIGALISGGIALNILISKHKIRIRKQPLSTLIFYLKDGASIFWFKFTGTFKTSSNQVFLGLMTGLKNVVFYDLAIKISGVFIGVFQNFSQAIFPRMVQKKEKSFAKKALLITSIASISIYLIIALIIQIVIKKWDIEMLPTAKLFWLLGLLIPTYAVAEFSGNSILVANGYERKNTFTTVWTTFLFIGLLILCYLMHMVNIYTLSYALLISQISATLHKIYYCKKYKLI
jgi:polysaccharide transporter, PST family